MQVFIDFGLAVGQAGLEDKGVDLYVLERAISSGHKEDESDGFVSYIHCTCISAHTTQHWVVCAECLPIDYRIISAVCYLPPVWNAPCEAASCNNSHKLPIQFAHSLSLIHLLCMHCAAGCYPSGVLFSRGRLG